MNRQTQSHSAPTRIRAGATPEMGSDYLIKSLTTAALLFLLDIIVLSSFAALIFSGALAGQVASGLSLFRVGNAILIIVLASLSSFSGSVGTAQDAPMVILALAATDATRAMVASATPAPIVPTVVVMLVAATLATGLVFMLLGFCKLGWLVRFLPCPVLGGFLAGTGWLLPPLASLKVLPSGSWRPSCSSS